jgi:outer membrane biosynthesis protein TonB
MSAVRTSDSLRREQVEITRLAWAFGLSLLLHLALFGSFQLGRKYGWWQHIHWPTWIQSRKASEQQLTKKAAEALAQEEIPLTFVEVSPQQAVAEPPKNAKYYSTQNSRAANQEADKDVNIPKIDGKRPELAKTEDVPKEKFVPLQPVPPVPPTPPAKELQEEVKPAPTYKPGDLAIAKPEAKPDPEPKKGEGEAKHERPKTVQEALARMQAKQMPGQKMLQDGGLSLHRLDSLDAKATPYGNYDWGLVNAIREAWHQSLEDQKYAADYRGKVMVRFRLHYDGSITDLLVVENTAGFIPGTLCENAISKPKPYNRFPPEMRRVVGDIRSIQFTFFYD